MGKYLLLGIKEYCSRLVRGQLGLQAGKGTAGACGREEENGKEIRGREKDIRSWIYSRNVRGGLVKREERALGRKKDKQRRG